MKLQAILSSVALVAAMSLSGAAVAQDAMIGDVVVPAEQLDAVKDACAALQAKSTASLTSSDTEDSTAVDEMETGSTEGNDGSGQADSPDPASQDYWDNLIAGLTLEDCKAGGF